MRAMYPVGLSAVGLVRTLDERLLELGGKLLLLGEERRFIGIDRRLQTLDLVRNCCVVRLCRLKIGERAFDFGVPFAGTRCFGR